MATVTVSIGRNVGSEPMSSAQWDLFTDIIGAAVADNSVSVYVDAAESVGEWLAVAEQSRTWVAEVATFDAVNAIAAVSQQACKRFGQDAVAVTIAGTFLVGA